MKKLLFIPLLALVIVSCKKDKADDAAPSVSFDSFITYKNAAGKDTAIDFVFKFKDDNGDISYSQAEQNSAPCSVNLKDLRIMYEEKRGSDYFLKRFLLDSISPCDTSLIYHDSISIDLNAFLPDISPAENPDPIEGTVTNRISYATLIGFSSTGRLTFYINDRAGHRSNVVHSPDLIIVK